MERVKELIYYTKEEEKKIVEKKYVDYINIWPIHIIYIHICKITYLYRKKKRKKKKLWRM